MIHTTEGFKSRLDMVEKMINEIELEKRNTKKLRHKEKKESLRAKKYGEKCVTNANGNIFTLEGYQKKKREKKGVESVIEEVITENFPNLGKEIVSQAMEVHRSPNTGTQGRQHHDI